MKAHQVHKSFLKPSQLPGEYIAQLLPFQRIHVYMANQTQQPTLPSQVPIYSWVERSNYGKVSCSRTHTVSTTDAVGVRTHILTTQPSEHMARIWIRASVLHVYNVCTNQEIHVCVRDTNIVSLMSKIDELCLDNDSTCTSHGNISRDVEKSSLNQVHVT